MSPQIMAGADVYCTFDSSNRSSFTLLQRSRTLLSSRHWQFFSVLIHLSTSILIQFKKIMYIIGNLSLRSQIKLVSQIYKWPDIDNKLIYYSYLLYNLQMTQVRGKLVGNMGSSSGQVKKGGRVGIAFVLAGLITGANWLVQSRLAKSEQARNNQIIKRVNSNQTSQIGDLIDFTRASELEGTKVKVTGQLHPERFVIKRKRGDQQGYIVLAPFIIDKIKSHNRFDKTENTKYMLNLGWIPKESRHKIRNAAAIDILKFDDLPEELAADEDAPATSTISAYVRKGEQRDIVRGYNNWHSEKLFKFIDLNLMERLFSTVHASFRHVYLDRIGQEGEQSFPFPTNADHYIDELKQETTFNNKKRGLYTVGVGLASFISAALLAAL